MLVQRNPGSEREGFDMKPASLHLSENAFPSVRQLHLTTLYPLTEGNKHG